MPESVAHDERRASRICVAGVLLVWALFVPGLLVLTVRTRSLLLYSEAAHLLAAGVIWLVLWIVFAQRRRAVDERVETEDLRRTRATAGTVGIFDSTEERLLLQQRRLRTVYRWLLPCATILLIVDHLTFFYRWYFVQRHGLDRRFDPNAATATEITVALFAMAGVGFLCFLYSRYVNGMARQPQWRMLRAGGVYMTGNALACLAVVVALGFRSYDYPQIEPWVTGAIRVLMLILGLEFLVNLILDFYRPRAADAEPRPSFDSRLLALISEPTGIARSIAEAINYQFGFEVSGTWFYKLLQRALLPLTLVTLFVLAVLSCVVVVDADQQAVIETVGKPMDPDEAPLGPGLHFKAPWPFQKVYRHSVDQIHEIVLGGIEQGGHKDEHAPILWTEQHKFVPETMLLLATPELARISAPVDAEARPDAAPRSKAVGVSLLMVSTHIAYRVKNLRDYLYTYQNPEAAIESVAYEALTEYGAARDISGIMGPDRESFSNYLRERVQKEADARGLGVEITFLALQDAHPPPDNEVAKTFQDVITSEQKKEAAIRTAVGKAEIVLTEVAGSVERANLLDELDRQRDGLQRAETIDVQAVEQLDRRIDALLLGDPATGISPMSGSAGKQINEARAKEIRQLSEAEADARVFANQVVSYKVAPRVFVMRQWLDALRKAIQKPRKYIVTGDRKATDLILILETGETSTGLNLGSPPGMGP